MGEVMDYVSGESRGMEFCVVCVTLTCDRAIEGHELPVWCYHALPAYVVHPLMPAVKDRLIQIATPRARDMKSRAINEAKAVVKRRALVSNGLRKLLQAYFVAQHADVEVYKAAPRRCKSLNNGFDDGRHFRSRPTEGELQLQIGEATGISKASERYSQRLVWRCHVSIAAHQLAKLQRCYQAFQHGVGTEAKSSDKMLRGEAVELEVVVITNNKGDFWTVQRKIPGSQKAGKLFFCGLLGLLHV